jgi:uncharacterized Tic20 family protein
VTDPTAPRPPGSGDEPRPPSAPFSTPPAPGSPGAAPTSGGYPPGGYEAPPGGYQPPPAAPGYGQPTSGPGYGQPTSGPGYGPPTSGGGPGYGQPPTSGAGYPPQGGSQAPGYGQPNNYGPQGNYGQPGGYPNAAATSDTQTWTLIAHFGGVAGVVIGGTVAGWVAPLVAYAVRGNTDPVVRAHSVEALNFHITWAIANALAWIVFACGSAITLGFGAIILWVLPLATFLVAVVFGIIGGIKASNGELYRYPLTYRMVK